MRSTLKILLGITFIVGTVFGFGFAAFAIFSILPHSPALKNVDPSIFPEGINYALFIMIMLFILSILSFINAIVSYRAIKKMNKAIKKTQLIPTIIALIIINPVVSLMMLFTPSKRLISKQPYFE